MPTTQNDRTGGPATSITTDRQQGLVSGAAMKGPCYVATTANITLQGEKVIDGALTAASRVLVKDQTNPIDNGIWLSSTGDWVRAPDFFSNDSVREGTRVFVTDGSANARVEFAVTTADPINIGTTPITFVVSSLAQVSGQMGAAIHAATTKATPIDADEFGFWDSVSSALRKLTWANIKTTLASTFLPLTGGTLTGDLTIAPAAALAFLKLNNPGSAHRSEIDFQRSGSSRFQLFMNGDATGDIFGSVIDDSAVSRSALQIERASGRVALPQGQLTFPSTANPSSDANTLDDYEEGTFTPIAVGTTIAGAGTYTLQTGFYTKIGRLVHISLGCAWSAHTGTGNLKFSGIPFTAFGNNRLLAVLQNYTFAGIPFGLMGVSGITEIGMFTFATGATHATLAMDTAAEVFIVGSYPTI